MFSANHYVPLLRWKLAEMGALRTLPAQDRERITPLIEIIPRDFGTGRPTLNEVTRNKAKQIWGHWGKTAAFVDLGLLPSARAPQVTDCLCECAQEMKLRLVPVVAPDRSRRAMAAVRRFHKQRDSGVCLRVDGCALDQPSVDLTLRHLAITPGECDLVVDLKGESRDLATLCSDLPHLSGWRSFTLLQGSFPQDLTGIPVGRYLIPRSDWANWSRYHASAPAGHRLPTFGDYTIQHPHFKEPPGRANFSASIRYATTNHWLIMRGEGVFNKTGPGFAQWPANAILLRDEPEYCGATFSYGDDYIDERASHPEKSGNAGTWLRAGINHHIVFVLRQLADLHEKPKPAERPL